MINDLNVKYLPVFFFLHKEIMKLIEKASISPLISNPVDQDSKFLYHRNPLNPYYGGKLNLRYEPGVNLNVDPQWLWPDYGGGSRMTQPTPHTLFGDRYKVFASDVLNRYLPSDSFEETITGYKLYLDRLEVDESGELKAIINNDLASFNLIIKFWNRQPLEDELEYFSFSDLLNQEELHQDVIHYVNEVLSSFSSDPQLKLVAEIDNISIIDIFSQVKQHRFTLSAKT